MNKEFVPVSDIDSIHKAIEIFPLSPGDSRYIDCAKIRGSDTIKIIERKLRRGKEGHLHLLFTGYRGNGKTTELYQFKARLEKDYEFIYFDAKDELDLYNCKLTDILMAIAKETHDSLNKAGYKLPKKILQEAADWFFEVVLEKDKSVSAEIGAEVKISSPKWFSFITGKIFSKMKLGTDEREIMRRKLENNLPALIKKINILLQSADQQIKNKGKKGMVFLMDSLDRLKEGIDRELFIANGSFINQLYGSFIFVVPISLKFNKQANLLEFDDEILPMIPVIKKGKERSPHDGNIEQLKKLIAKRIVVDAIFSHPEDSLKEIILTSGGHLRDLMRLLHYASSRTDDKINPGHVKIAVNKLINDYERVVRDDQYSLLAKVYREQTTSNDTVSRNLIYHNVILVYHQRDEAEWKDVHPAVVRNEKFQKALKG